MNHLKLITLARVLFISLHCITPSSTALVAGSIQYELGHNKKIKNLLYELVVSIHTRAVVLRHDAGEKSLSNSPET